ncbi:MAG: EamA family transporter [Bacteroidetes bacterium 4572_77]|nr:MAG: EamA family transporter [Bacteroidetes bacterium 4572_77]
MQDIKNLKESLRKQRNNFYIQEINIRTTFAKNKTSMKSAPLFSSFLLVITAALWGFSFVAQRAGMEHIGPYLFNGIRFTLGSLCLWPLLLFFQKKRRKKNTPQKNILASGIILGIVLLTASSLQQIGMQYTNATNGGFITSLYVVIVPIILLFFGEKIPFRVIAGAILALIGLYFISIQDHFQLSEGDTLVLWSALFWAIHVILLGKFARKDNIILLSIIQFTTTAIASLIIALLKEEIQLEAIQNAAIPIIYGGVFSVGMGYTLQALAQKKVRAETAAIILSFESAFAMLGGWLILSEPISMQSLFGASLMLIGILISQIKSIKTTS